MSRYGNYRPDFELKPYEPFLARLRRFCLKVKGFISKMPKVATIAVFVAVAGIVGGCRQQEVVVEKERLVYVTKDSIVHRDSTVFVPYEVYRDYSLDTLVLRTSLAESRSWLDTASAYLVGEIRNLKSIETKYIEVERWRTRDTTIFKEKIEYVPQDVIVEKKVTPTWAWICLLWTVTTIISICYSIYKKFF